MTESFELGPFRPPSEAFSLLIRATRNCPWNRCRFCGMYKREKFQLRTVDEIKKDIETAAHIRDMIKEQAWKAGNGGNIRQAAAAIVNNPPNHAFQNVALWMYGGGQNVFLQDANTIIMRTPELVEVLNFMRETLPDATRITSYGRSKTAAKKTLDELVAIHEAGLTRLHVGLESGSDTVLQKMDKGVTAAEQITALETARVLSEINPDFIRIRTLNVSPGLVMFSDIEDGSFTLQSDDGMVEELKLLIENLDCESNFVSDHINNLLQELKGKLPDDKQRLLDIIDRYKSLSPEEKTNFRVGRRARIYTYLNEMNDDRKYSMVQQIVDRLSNGTGVVAEETTYRMRLGY